LNKFAFIIHPLEINDLTRKFGFAKCIPGRWLERAVKYLPPVKVSHITGVRSPHAEAEGWFIGCPLTSRQMM